MIDHSPLFLGKGEVYDRARNDFAPEAISWIAERTGFGPGKTALDVGAGTGMLTRHLLELGGEVIALDPNPDMLSRLRDRWPALHTLTCRAEQTPLTDESVDLVVCGRSFHWLDQDAALAEFRRLLRPPKWLALLWVPRVETDHPAWRAMSEVMSEAKKTYPHRVPWGREERSHFGGLFGGGYEMRLFPQQWEMDEGMFVGLAESRSYFPLPDDLRHEPLVARLREAFQRHVPGGRFTVPFETEVHLARL